MFNTQFASVRFNCKAIKNWSRNPGNKLSLECKLSVPKTKSGTETDYNWRQAAGSAFGVYHKKKATRKKTAVKTSEEHPATLEHRITHVHTCFPQAIHSAHAHLLAGLRCSYAQVPVQKPQKNELSGWALKTKLHSSVQHCYKPCNRVS